MKDSHAEVMYRDLLVLRVLTLPAGYLHSRGVFLSKFCFQCTHAYRPFICPEKSVVRMHGEMHRPSSMVKHSKRSRECGPCTRNMGLIKLVTWLLLDLA